MFDSSWCTGSKCSAAIVFNDELRKLLDGCDIDKILEILSDYSDMNGVKSYIEDRGGQDYIHLLLDCKPQFFISDMIKIMKGNLARQLFLSHPVIKTGTVGRTFVESILLCSYRK